MQNYVSIHEHQTKPNPALAAVHGQAALLLRYDVPIRPRLLWRYRFHAVWKCVFESWLKRPCFGFTDLCFTGQGR
jgi:hypothetical protein